MGVLIFVFANGLVALGYQIAKHRYNKPFDTKVERDTVTKWDTIPHWYPKPIEVQKLGTEYKWLTRVEESTDTLHDSVMVAVPITSKHFHDNEYDAYISGFEPNLDSIFIYNETQYITETTTISKPPDRWELDIVGGLDYGITSKQWQPYCGGELTLNNHKRLKVAIEGGVKKNDLTNKFEPYSGIKAKVKVF